MNRTSIEWVRNPDGSQGYTWNPITGCLNGCPYCYARKLANGRLKTRYLANTNTADIHFKSDRVDALNYALAATNPFYPRFWESRLHDRGLFQEEPRGIFTCDMSDLFGIGVPEAWTDRVIDQVKVHRQHRFYLLTKQPQNLPTSMSYFPDNCWVGVSATDAQMFIDAGHALEGIHAKVKYISAEPLLDWEFGGAGFIATMLQQWAVNWIIIGAQTKPFRAPKIEWVEEIVSAADKAGIPTFLKDNLQPLLGEREAGIRVGSHKEIIIRELRQEVPRA